MHLLEKTANSWNFPLVINKVALCLSIYLSKAPTWLVTVTEQVFFKVKKCGVF